MNLSLERETNTLPLIQNTKKKRKSRQSWELSYGDMVTALLCFFIIFYALEKQHEKKIITNPLKSYSEKEGILQEHKVKGVDTEFEYALESLQKISNIEVHRTSSFVDIYFNKIVFFERGKANLTNEGKLLIDDVLKKLTGIEGRFLLEIQGHADKTPVLHKKTRWWQNNMELSVLRALKVHTYLAEKYIEKDRLVVSGYGSQQRINNVSEEEAINRRITLRLQLIK